MFTLGIIDTLKAEDLTGGMIIAGTGTIDDEGNVGPIGGIPQKLVAAKAAKAKVFLTPAANCAEALDNAAARPAIDQGQHAGRRAHRARPRCVPAGHPRCVVDDYAERVSETQMGGVDRGHA